MGTENIKNYEVVVCGGGTAGAIAAIAAARQGAETLLIEEYGFLGGTATAGLVTPWMGNKASGIPLNQGIANELKLRLKEIGGHSGGAGGDGWFDPEMLKYVLEEMALQAGVQLLYFTRVIDVMVEDNRLVQVVVHNKAGLSQIGSDVFIDATGDGDVAHLAGVPTESGRETDGMKQALSLRFILGNVDVTSFAEYLGKLEDREVDPNLIHAAMVWGKKWPLEPLFRKGVDEGILNEEDGDYFQFFSIPGRPGEFAFNCPRISERVDATNPEHLTDAQITGKQAILRLLRFCRKYLPGFEQAFLSQTGPMVGIRESRRIVGEYVITLEDILSARKFPDGICRNHYPVDVHVPRGQKGPGLIQEFEDRPYHKLEEYHEVPYRCLVPLQVDGLIVTGRCLSATFEAQSSIRVQPNCHTLGEAAGVAAALAVRTNIAPRKLDGTKVRAIMQETGSYL